MNEHAPKQPPLLLEDYFFPEISVKANPKYSPQTDTGDIVVKTFSLLNWADPNHDRAILQLHLTFSNEDNAPYSIEAHIVGTFSVHRRQDAEQLVALTGGAMLYGAVRDFVLTVTGRGPWDKFIIPTLAPIELMQNLEVVEHEPKEAPKSKPKRQKQRSQGTKKKSSTG